jgi:hypothetical protein
MPTVHCSEFLVGLWREMWMNISEIFDFVRNLMESMSPVHLNVHNTHGEIELKVHVDMGNAKDASFYTFGMSGERDGGEYPRDFRFWDNLIRFHIPNPI